MDCFGLFELSFMVEKHIDYGRYEIERVCILEDLQRNQAQKSSNQTDDVS